MRGGTPPHFYKEIKLQVMGKEVKKEEERYCGECLCFTHEDTDGYGLCFLDNEIKYCGDAACSSFNKEYYRELKFIRNEDENVLSVFIDDNKIHFHEEGDGYGCSIIVSKSEFNEIIKNLKDENS